jgi:hemolysin activation/secretion protein
LPYGYNTVSANVSRSRYASTIMTPMQREFGISGDADNASVRFERVMFRNQSSRFNLAATLTTKDSKNYLAGELLAVSSRKLSVAELDASFSTGWAGGVLGADLGWAHGLRAFSALRDVADLPDEAPRAQFDKLKFGLSYSRPFKLAGKDAAFSSQLAGQHARHALYGSEQILIGGIYSVRGFQNLSLSGDHGYTWRNDVSVRLPLQVMNQSVMLKPYLALDHGHVSSRASGVPGGSISGMALGCTLTVAGATWEIFNSRPLSVPQGMQREGSATYFRLALSI